MPTGLICLAYIRSGGPLWAGRVAGYWHARSLGPCQQYECGNSIRDLPGMDADHVCVGIHQRGRSASDHACRDLRQHVRFEPSTKGSRLYIDSVVVF